MKVADDIWNRIFLNGLNPIKSSLRPEKNITIAAEQMYLVLRAKSLGAQRMKDKINPKKIEIPPKEGVGKMWFFLFVGVSKRFL